MDDARGNVPTDGSADAIAAFLAAEQYTGDGWRAETAAPRPPAFASSPHARVRVFLNDTLVASQAAGNGELDSPPHTPLSMAVKELYDESDARVGIAAIFRTEAGPSPDATAYFCFGPAGRCATDSPAFPETAPAYGRGLTLECGACHGGTFYTELPSPQTR